MLAAEVVAPLDRSVLTISLARISRKSLCKVFCPGMVVAHQHARVLMARDFRQLVQREYGRQSRSRLVAQVVKAKINQKPRFPRSPRLLAFHPVELPSTRHCPFERPGYSVAPNVKIGPVRSAPTPLTASQDLSHLSLRAWPIRNFVCEPADEINRLARNVHRTG